MKIFRQKRLVSKLSPGVDEKGSIGGGTHGPVSMPGGGQAGIGLGWLGLGLYQTKGSVPAKVN